LAILELDGVSKHFGAIQALTGVSLRCIPARSSGLMGDNGAGKSTLVKIIAGNYPQSEGSIALEGQPRRVSASRPMHARPVSRSSTRILRAVTT
jgi:simple sugar transport system ATP-binding protein